MTMKTCTTCNQSKALDDYPRRPKARDGHATICRDCFSLKIKAASADRLKPREKAKKPKPVILEDRRCTCTPGKYARVESIVVKLPNGSRVRRLRSLTYTAHSALCMIFAHNQLDPHRKQQNTLEPVPQPFGTRRLWR